MLSRRIFILILMSVLALTGCPPKQNKKETLRTGRTRLSPTGTAANGQATSYSSSNPSTIWGSISGTDANFNQSVYLFAQPALDGAPEDDQLGYVSPQAAGNSGIIFWGSVNRAANGQIDSNNSRLHIEIWDSKFGQVRADGSTNTQLFIHIGPEQEGFGGVQGGPNEMIFSSSHMTILLQGSTQNSVYSGTMYFANVYTNYQWVALGQFQVPRNGFFNF